MLSAAAAVLSASAVLASGLPTWAKILAVCATLLAGARWLAIEGVRMAGRSVVRLVLLDADASMVVERTGRKRSVRLVHGAVIGSLLLVIVLRLGRWRTRTLCIGRDAVDREAFRRLSVRLNVSSPAAARPGSRLAKVHAMIRRRRTD